MSQSDVARAAGISRSYVSCLECDAERSVTTEVMAGLAKALGVDEQYLMQELGVKLGKRIPQMSPLISLCSLAAEELPPQDIYLVSRFLRWLLAEAREQQREIAPAG